MIVHGARAAAEAARLRGLEGNNAGAPRAAEDARLLLGIADAAASLSILRRGTADELGRAVSAVLAVRVPPDAFAVEVGRGSGHRDDPAVEVDAVAFDASGIDTVVFTFRPNPGEPAPWRGSRRAASCRGSPSRSSRCWPRSTRRRRSCSTRSTRGSRDTGPPWGEASGPWPAPTRCCA